jgi:hypothetical protein
VDENLRKSKELENNKRIADFAEKSGESIEALKVSIAAVKDEVISVRLQNDALQSSMDEVKEALSRLLASSRSDVDDSGALEEANDAQTPGRKAGRPRGR